MLDQITPLLLTRDEEPNIRRTLAKLGWARRIVVVDSGSTDATLAILAGDPRIEVVHRDFDDFARQWNFGLGLVRTPWVLSLDADYLLSDELIGEIAALRPDASTLGYRGWFIYCVGERKLRGSLYPPRVILFRAGAATYRQDGHTQRLVIDEAAVRALRGRVYHDDRKPLGRWLAAQRAYARDEADHLLGGGPLNRADRLRRMAWPAPFAALLYVLLVKRCMLDGWPGWRYALQRFIAEALLALEIIDRRLGGARR